VSAKIVVADLESPWREALISAIETAEPLIRVTDLGNELCRALEEVANPPKIIIIGPSLRGMGGLEALYQAERTLLFEKKERPTWPTRTVSLITDVRSDAELLDLYRRRGVTHFIYRDDPIEKTVSALLANLKPASRAMVRIDAVTTIEGKNLSGAVYDLSQTGAQLVVEATGLRTIPSVGTTLPLQLMFNRSKLKCKAEIRGLTTKNGSQGQHLFLGLQFATLDDDQCGCVERMIREAAEEYEMANSDSVIMMTRIDDL
jgi:hypothetical protein